jgi:hypothetical protein
MERGLKIIFAIGIAICMFLPLSKCSGDSPKLHAAQSKSESVSTTTINSAESESEEMIVKFGGFPTDIQSYLIYLAFISPLLCCIPLKKSTHKVAMLSVQTILLFWLFFVIYVFVYSFKPLYGGYLLSVFSILYFVLTLFEWHKLYLARKSKAT